MAVKTVADQALYLDRSIAIYVFLPITFIMLLVGLGWSVSEMHIHTSLKLELGLNSAALPNLIFGLTTQTSLAASFTRTARSDAWPAAPCQWTIPRPA